VVQDGQTIQDIAMIFAVRVQDIRKYNGLTDNEEPTPGQVLVVPIQQD
jgi:LysM repeat protein